MSASSRAPISNAVLMREAARNSRRWQIYGARMGFSGVLMALLLLGIWASINVATDLLGGNATELSKLGRGLFVVFTILQTLLALVMAPMMVSRAIIEERTDRTIELMVLTPIQLRNLLVSKILSQILSILLIIIGALPILGMVLSLGGVGVDELVVITAGMVVTVVLMGVFGAFFSMFTESPLIATLASLFWAVGLYIMMPITHSTLSGSIQVSAQVSPFFANAGNWWGLLILVSYIPIIWITLEMAARMFELRVSNAELRRYFSPQEWMMRKVGIAALIWFVSSIVVVPGIIGLSWWSAATFQFASPTLSSIQGTLGPAVAGGVGRLLSLLWVMCLGTLLTWVYLRLGMDLVDVFDGILGGTGRSRSRKKRSVGHKIFKNPVFWREARISGWGGGSIGLFVMWFMGMLAVFQTGLWVFPGGLLTIGILNAVAGTALSIWSSAGSIEQERRRGTLTLLVVSTLSSWRIVWGKTLAVLIPASPFLLVAALLVFFGHPHLAFIDIKNADFTWVFVRGTLATLWWVPVWLSLVHLSQWVGLRMKKRNTVYTSALSLAVLALGLPAFAGWILKDLWIVSVPARIIAAGLMPFAAPWELGLSIPIWGFVALLLHVMLVRNFRTWGGTVDG